MKVNTDSCILGASVDYRNPEKVLDIGSGTGVLSIMAAQKFPLAHIHGVEVDRIAFEQATENIAKCPWSDRIQLFNNRIQEFLMQGITYDLILSNPPYFQDHLKSGNPALNVARHNESLQLEELAFAVNKLLSSHGSFYLILPPEPYGKVRSELALYEIFPFHILNIYQKPGNPLYRLIGGFGRLRKKENKKKFYISDGNGEYSEQFKVLLKEYYLAF
jgi:tRNA1Val (adenine37-N6)-methyltransferase